MEIGGCDLVDLTEKYGTPLYVIDEKTLRSICRDYKKAFEVLSSRFNISYENMIYVGDNPNKDFYISIYGINTVRLYNKKGIYFHDKYKDDIKEKYCINKIVDILDILKMR